MTDYDTSLLFSFEEIEIEIISQIEAHINQVEIDLLVTAERLDKLGYLA